MQKKHPKEEITFVMVKSDGVQKGLIGEVIQRFEQRGLKITALEMFRPSHEEIDHHYPKDESWIRRLGQKTLATYEKYGYDAMEEVGTKDDLEIGKIVRKWLLEYMLAAPLVKMAVQGVHAVDVVRKICGATFPYMAEIGTIRGDYSIDSPALANKEKRAVKNLLHASETPEEAEHEIEHWFGKNFKLHSYKRHGVDE